MAIDLEKKSNRLLGGRRFTSDDLLTSQEAFSEVLDLRATEIYTDANLIPTDSLPFNADSDNQSIHSVGGKPVVKYHYRHRLTKSSTTDPSGKSDVWFFITPTSTDGVTPQLIQDGQQTNFISPKYSVSTLANANVEDTTAGYNIKVFKESSTNTNSASFGDTEVVSANDYQFDYKTGVLQFNDNIPTSTEIVYISAYQYVGSTLQENLNLTGALTASGGITASHFSGSGAGLTDIPSTAINGTLSQWTASEGYIYRQGEVRISGSEDTRIILNDGAISASGTVMGTNIMTITASLGDLFTTSASLSTSISSTSSSLGVATSSITNISSSLGVATSSITNISSSIGHATASITDITASIDTLAGGNFSGTNITSSNISASNITASSIFSVGEISASGFKGDFFEITSSVLITSESTEFGNSLDDTHFFSGSITSSGNISSSGNIFGTELHTTKLININDTDTSIDLESNQLTITANGAAQFVQSSGATTINTPVTINDPLLVDGLVTSSHLTASIDISSPLIYARGTSGVKNEIIVNESDDGNAAVVLAGHSGFGSVAAYGAGTINVFLNGTGNQTSYIRNGNLAIGTVTNATDMELTVEGDISASGVIYADSLQVGGSQIGASLIVTDISASGDITASGEISSSGDILTSANISASGTVMGSNIYTITASLGDLFTNSDSLSASIASTSSSLGVATSSITNISSSLVHATASITTLSSSLGVATSSITNISSSLGHATASITTLSSSLGVVTSSLTNLSSSIGHATASITDITARLDKGNFIGTNITSSNISASGDITASNIFATGQVSASVLKTNFTEITSSIIITSASTEFGNSEDDTHVFSGSITASGNISSSGTIISNVITPTTITNINTTHITASGNMWLGRDLHLTNITASGNISASYTSTGSFGRIEADTINFSNFNPTSLQVSNISIGDKISHTLDGDTYIDFDFDQLRMNIGDIEFFNIQERGNDTNLILFNNDATNTDYHFTTDTSRGGLFITSSGQVGLFNGDGTQPSTLSVGGDLTTDSHITASGEISASGNILTSGNISASGIVMGTNIMTITASLGELYEDSQQATASIEAITSSIHTISSSLGVATSSITNISSSLGVATSSITNISSSLGVVTSSLTNISSSLGVVTSSLTNISSSLGVVTSSLTNLSSSIGQVTASITSLSSSIGQVTASITSLSSSIGHATASITDITSSIDTFSSGNFVDTNITSSNISASNNITASHIHTDTLFVGDTSVGSGLVTTNISASGNITASNIFATGTVSASVLKTDFTEITSSIIITSASTEFGNSLDDTHHFSGSITSSGNISSSGTITANVMTPTTITTVSTTNITASHNISSSGGDIIGANISASGTVFGTNIYQATQSIEYITSSIDYITASLGELYEDTQQATQSIEYITSSIQTLTDNVGQINSIDFQMTNSSSVVDNYLTSFRTAKYLVQVTSASDHIQSSELLVVQSASKAFSTEYAQINSGLELINFSTDVDGGSVRLIASSSFVSCSVKLNRTLI